MNTPQNAGGSFPNTDIEQWGKEAEEGFTDWKFGKPVSGTPVAAAEHWQNPKV